MAEFPCVGQAKSDTQRKFLEGVQEGWGLGRNSPKELIEAKIKAYEELIKQGKVPDTKVVDVEPLPSSLP